jgi:hypothetical protein
MISPANQTFQKHCRCEHHQRDSDSQQPKFPAALLLKPSVKATLLVLFGHSLPLPAWQKAPKVSPNRIASPNQARVI